jgi:hypothetical protein
MVEYFPLFANIFNFINIQKSKAYENQISGEEEPLSSPLFTQ